MLNEYHALNVIKFRHMLTPIAIDWAQHTPGHAYSSLYIFGIRIARWRADKQ